MLHWVNREWAGHAAGSSHVRNASLATVGPKRRPVGEGQEPTWALQKGFILLDYFVGARKQAQSFDHLVGDRE